MIRSYARQITTLIKTARNWPMYFLSRLGWTGETVTWKLRCGLTLTTRPHTVDGSCLNDVWFSVSYDPNAYGIRFDWKAARTIIDVGAHVGTFTLFAADRAPNARIFALEPDLNNLALIKQNVAQNDLSRRVTVLPLGIGSGEPVTLYTFPENRGGNSVFRAAEGGTPVTIQTTSLQALFDRHSILACDYLKLDCEGAEYEALYALPAGYFERIGCIGLEYHHFSSDQAHNSQALEQFLTGHGFRVIRHKKSMLLAIR